MLSRLAAELAAEIAGHDWSTRPWRLNRAGHQRDTDTNRGPRQLNATETDGVRTNVMWVTAQALKHSDPNLDLYEYAKACGVPRHTTHNQDGFTKRHAFGWRPHERRSAAHTPCSSEPGEALLRRA